MVTASLGAASDCAKVERIMIANSTPYILRLPKTSASHPNPSWPATAPPAVAALMAVFTFVGSVP